MDTKYFIANWKSNKKKEDAIEFLNTHDKKGWVNLKVNKARGGNFYIELNTYEPRQNNTNEDKEPLPF